ncbi:MAG: hypothetical protein ACF8OB_05160 [Phycisphaeraceae bacterium JB051]
MPNMIPGSTTLTFPVTGPLYCPYYNIWGRDVYMRDHAFSDNPFTINASSTSGSPAIVDAKGQFFHFMTDAVEQGCQFAFDGKDTLAVTIPQGQTLYHDDNCDADTAWKHCNSLIMAEHPLLDPNRQRPAHWDMIEYCTWVEQKRIMGSGTPHEVLNDAFLDDYMQRVDAMGFPKGKFTIDHGWTPGHFTYGDWDVDTARFPDFAKTIGRIADNGFVPGLWMAPVWLHHLSRLVKNNPHLKGPMISPSTPDSPNKEDDWYYWIDSQETFDLIKPVFARFIDMGVRKFKWDMIYADKSFMKKLHILFYKAVKEIDPQVEVEIHQPDIFFAQYGDAIRTNDVLCNEKMAWRDLTLAHFKVCNQSSPGKVINLDHIAGNDPAISPERFCEHLDLYRGVQGYPVVSLLPDSIGTLAVDTLRDYLKAYEANPTPVSTFYQQ